MERVTHVLEEEIKQLRDQLDEIHNDVFYKPYYGNYNRDFQKSLERYDRICSEYRQTLKIMDKIKELSVGE